MLRNLFEAEMLIKDQISTSTKQKTKKELLKLIDMVRISMQTEEEDFTEFYLKKIFVLIKDSNSLNFHNFLIEICKVCELPDEICESCKENLEKLKQKGKEKPLPPKIPENILSSAQLPPNELERTVSTLTNDGNLKRKLSFFFEFC